jgi:hypothetical protein
MMETVPWSGRPFNNQCPNGAVRALPFAGFGLITNLILVSRPSSPSTTPDHPYIVTQEPRPANADTPSLGLASRQPEDAGWFFGREDVGGLLVAKVVARRPGDGMIVVVGVSGAGRVQEKDAPTATVN